MAARARRITTPAVEGLFDGEPRSKYVPKGLTGKFTKWDARLLRVMDGLLDRLHDQYRQGKKLYQYDESRPSGEVNEDEVDPALAKETWLVVIQAFGTENMANRFTEIPLRVVRSWQQTDPDFVDLLAERKLLFAQRAVDRLHGRVLDEDGPFDPMSATLTMFAVKKNFPEYRENAPLAQPAPPSASVTVGFPNPYLAAKQGRLPPPLPPPDEPPDEPLPEETMNPTPE